MGLSSLGYRRRTLEEIVEAKKIKARELFGEDINTEGNTPLGKFILINAYDQYNVEELAEQIYYSIFPSTATGQALDRLAWTVGITRNVATPAKYSVELACSGTGETIPYGFRLQSDSGAYFYNTSATVVESNKATIIVECEEAGEAGNVAPSIIVNPVGYIDSITSTELLKIGDYGESDNDFRKRYELVREGRGGCSQSSIVSALLSIPSVRGAIVIANESNETDGNGIPAKTIACYIDGGEGEHQDIAEAIFDKKPIGVATHGDVMVNVNYGGLVDYPIKFSHPDPKDICIKIAITTNNKFSSDGIDEIVTNILSHFDDLTIGDSLITTAMYANVYSVIGVSSATITVSENGTTYTTENITANATSRCSLKQLIINEDNEGEKVVYSSAES